MSPTNHTAGKVLVVDDDVDVLTAAQLLLKQHVTSVHTETRPDRILERMALERYDVILLDMNYSRESSSGQEGFFWLKQLLEQDPNIVIILITAFGDMEMAVRAIKMGATDFIVKPWQNEKLLATLNAAMEIRASRAEINRLRTTQQVLNKDLGGGDHALIGHSVVFRKAMEMIKKVAASDASVLLTGENGTGKELVARAIHRKSKRMDDAFISVDMGSITESLFESELFGHVKGSFTDAKQDKPGRFEIANGGTLFLDEIGNLNLAQQAKLLTTLERHCVTRVGSNASRPIDIRLICATNCSLAHMVANGSFRMDLLYRINTVEIHIPALRERKEDIPDLVESYLNCYAKHYRKDGIRLADDVIPVLCNYSWPGNVRELKHAVERAVILAEDSVLHAKDFFLPGMDSTDPAPLTIEDTSNLEEIERRVIRRVLQNHKGNISRAAQDLGLTRTSLYRRLDKYGI